ncbi:Transposase [Cordylochernes scorpioides]|uniref:Transposase n=1 Tax=Cordylochernes scorpioides TaxID=51811 RepID=A0ABY6LLM9_9ARAC|nr:Transposase [Cordylochernes scorpioides]
MWRFGGRRLGPAPDSDVPPCAERQERRGRCGALIRAEGHLLEAKYLSCTQCHPVEQMQEALKLAIGMLRNIASMPVFRTDYTLLWYKQAYLGLLMEATSSLVATYHHMGSPRDAMAFIKEHFFYGQQAVLIHWSSELQLQLVEIDQQVGRYCVARLQRLHHMMVAPCNKEAFQPLPELATAEAEEEDDEVFLVGSRVKSCLHRTVQRSLMARSEESRTPRPNQRMLPLPEFLSHPQPCKCSPCNSPHTQNLFFRLLLASAQGGPTTKLQSLLDLSKKLEERRRDLLSPHCPPNLQGHQSLSQSVLIAIAKSYALKKEFSKAMSHLEQARGLCEGQQLAEVLVEMATCRLQQWLSENVDHSFLGLLSLVCSLFGNVPDRCLFPKKVGPCRSIVNKFYFDRKLGDCKPFYWGGCRANGNNFSTLEICRHICKEVGGHFTLYTWEVMKLCRAMCRGDKALSDNVQRWGGHFTLYNCGVMKLCQAMYKGHRKWRQFKQTDAFTRGMVIGLKRAGWSIRQIAADTHLGASTVHRLWRRWLEQGNVAIYRNVGATRVTSARVDRRILRQAVAAPQATCTAILQHVQDTLDHSISTRTISRRLIANGLHSCRPLRRLPLTPPNRRQRLEWCRARSTWMTEWHRVVFSDESRFCLSSDSRRVRVWRRRGERSNPAAIVERPTVRQRVIMVWGAIAYDSRSPLLRIQGTMTAQRYVDDVLRPVTLPYLQGVPNALYQQDNARPHTARISQQALQDVQMLPWPPYSPDLSPIKHVWDIIGRRLHALPQPRSEDELWQMVEREWRAIPQDAIRTLIDSLPRRVAACIAVRGGPTCY